MLLSRILTGVIIALLLGLAVQSIIARKTSQELRAARERIGTLQAAYQAAEEARQRVSAQLKATNEILAKREADQQKILAGLSQIKRRLNDAYKDATPEQVGCADAPVPDGVTGILQHYGAGRGDPRGDPGATGGPSG